MFRAIRSVPPLGPGETHGYHRIHDHRPASTGTRGRTGTVYRVIIALDVLAVLLQGVWAGVFLEHDGERDAAGGWIDIRARGGEIAIALTLVAAVVGFAKLRHRKDLWIGSALLALVLLAEAYVGGLIRDDSEDTLTAVHVPLGMLAMGLVTVLAVRALRRA